MPSMQPTSDESQRLRGCVRDLVALSTLPTIWGNADPPSIGRSLAEVLLRMLSADFIYVRLHGRPSGTLSQAARTRQRAESPARAQEIGQALDPWLQWENAEAPALIPSPLGEGEVRLAVFPIGHGRDYGLLAAGCGRSDFPTDTERLLLSVAVNQAAGLLQRKEAEETLRKQTELLRVTLASIGDAVITTDTQGRVTSLNPIAESLTGWDQKDAQGMPLEQVFHIVNELTRQPVENPVQKALREGQVVGLANHTVLLAKDGTERAIDDSAAPIKDGQGNVIGVVLIFRDVTEARRTLETRLRLSAIVESCEDAIISKDLNGIIASWNKGAERLYGYTAEEIVGQPLSLLIPPDHPDELPTLIERLRRGERIEHYETVRVCKDGRRVEVSLTISPVKNAQGKIIGASKIARDITERKRLYQQLQEADRRKDEFLAILAHELRNPLAPVRNAVQILCAKGPSTPELQWARELIDRQVQQMTRLVDDLLDVSRITQGKIELRKERVELAAVVKSAVEASRALLDKGGHELTVTIPREPIYLEADRTRLAQVLMNLLNNAGKYTEPGGQIWLTAERDRHGIAIRVKDTGIGIPKEMLPHIFEMFTQVDSSLERSQGGLGIGLTLVQSLVEMHGGRVEAFSDGPGKGSEFVVHLPVSSDLKDPTVQGTADESAMLAACAKRRILIVDDNRDSADSLAMILHMMGHEVHTAHDGLEAVGAAAGFRPEVVLLDIGLPKLNGYEAARRIREQWGKDVVLVALTGWGQEEDRRRSKEAGFDHHLTKPMEFEALRQLLDRTGELKIKRDA